jgi:Spy/CpxP family protein refolding chaperone
MRPIRARWWLPALMVLGLAGSVHAQPPAPFVPGPWWKEFQKNLGLSDDQSSRIDMVFQTALPNLRHKRDELEAQETELSRLIQADADEVVIGKQSDRVEAIRAALNKSRTLMLVHMRQVMTPEQRTRLNALRVQWDKDHPPPPRGGDRNNPQPRRN